VIPCSLALGTTLRPEAGGVGRRRRKGGLPWMLGVQGSSQPIQDSRGNRSTGPREKQRDPPASFRAAGGWPPGGRMSPITFFGARGPWANGDGSLVVADGDQGTGAISVVAGRRSAGRVGWPGVAWSCDLSICDLEHLTRGKKNGVGDEAPRGREGCSGRCPRPGNGIRTPGPGSPPVIPLRRRGWGRWGKQVSVAWAFGGTA